ncbi:hypothetical protein pEaSNUABM14_00169 [Erwinia phage pEa_SNUABM_14]|uniref:Uncharacterized protein n=1 Tax=Erwinia phage pEa_SNUABM_7 TaxID=2866695 RepID=A0AAE7WUH6_9CAUD|nr:DNA polymerase [Erwinia phage pEa_SNUABM_7]QYW03129.1 hypothetical protein pEaSNUABM13_00170 [Erwinia phage pEa_SNUABM_13]QYW03470.1 hypothetical protein pEaSNUABM34_00168 [Erwinia phage pEa_SNUABM_34]QYW03812.1 hypothetical protein pEaSNUABM45_00169 [Erwinia phage pEa_SNUABM_45]QYW04153.1 hypothetical protein pEaSNUABM46_00169 [Erwinia phage pEa_SNUABM_46]QYW04494.1 hypothetical protein pEaSNUABM14_00169 [Erwinia phage pEa_SNUABM_14]QYW05183.1 hypothetical protein pEaSNUABM21_00169 [Erwin
MLTFDFEPAVAKQMQTLGVDPQLLFGKRETFDVVEASQDFKPMSPYFKGKIFSKTKQMTHLAKMIESPFGLDPRITVISSFPSDYRAKMAALSIFHAAVEDSETTALKPRWVTLYGDRFDYEQLKSKRPSMLIISNVTIDSTSYKIERLRDILEMFPKIPRIVVTGGGPDPMELFTRRVHLPVQAGISIGPAHVVSNLLDLMTSSL